MKHVLYSKTLWFNFTALIATIAMIANDPLFPEKWKETALLIVLFGNAILRFKTNTELYINAKGENIEGE